MIHEQRGACADRRLDGCVDPLHGLGDLVAANAITSGILVPRTKLPGAVHLVSKVPGLHAIGLLMTIFLTQVGPIGSTLKVCVFHNVHGILERSGSKVDGVKGLRSNLLRPLQILVMTHVIGDELIPCGIQVNLSLLLGANGILPLPCGYKISARQAAGRHSPSGHL